MDQRIAQLGTPPPRKPDEQLRLYYRWELEREKLKELERLKVTVESPERTALSSQIEGLKDLQIPPNMSEVSIEVGSSFGGYSAQAEFDLDHAGSSRYSVEGRDAQIVNGVYSTLGEELKKHHNSHSFAFKSRYSLTMSVLFASLVTYLMVRISMAAKLWIPPEPPGVVGVAAILVFILCAVNFPSLLAWMFPYFTYSEDPAERKRKLVKGLVVLVGGGLFISFIYDLAKLIFQF